MATIRDVVAATTAVMTREQLVDVIAKLAGGDVPSAVTINVHQDAEPSRVARSVRRGYARAVSAPRAPAKRPAQSSKSKAAKVPAEKVQAVLDEVVVFLSGKDGLRAEQIEQGLSLEKRTLKTVLRSGLKKGWLQKSGEKRSTTYAAAAVPPA